MVLNLLGKEPFAGSDLEQKYLKYDSRQELFTSLHVQLDKDERERRQHSFGVYRKIRQLYTVTKIPMSQFRSTFFNSFYESIATDYYLMDYFDELIQLYFEDALASI